eukprot:CAMPEP_0167751052 /NCGR_PEP_ID=MMETSP0110_2-20121227/6344_1 /TAXON_ID=629695 /ORGANISM="Gymnochlora sp., Strain CCMP2014" /LENGTH=181 /DNA_ID=CAMNT_0007636465 /DNA_START=221 /DNA_END=766 /DNA_ORIENTATION=+
MGTRYRKFTQRNDDIRRAILKRYIVAKSFGVFNQTNTLPSLLSIQENLEPQEPLEWEPIITDLLQAVTDDWKTRPKENPPTTYGDERLDEVADYYFTEGYRPRNGWETHVPDCIVAFRDWLEACGLRGTPPEKGYTNAPITSEVTKFYKKGNTDEIGNETPGAHVHKILDQVTPTTKRMPT